MGVRVTAVLWAAVASGGAASVDGLAELEVHPALEVRLFAREPEVLDPVAACWDAAGRMYVVEMRDYPYGMPPDNRPGGRVRRLEDRNRDGRADRSVVFADGLSFPTSIAAWRDGVLVAAPPQIVWLRDRDGDGRAEIKEVLWSGFKVGFTDANMSGLRWGLDNWLHGVNGGLGGEVTSARRPGMRLRLGDLDFRGRPETGEMETTFSTGGGFGLVFDAWGRSFTPHNVNHMQMRIAPARALGRNAGLAPAEGTASISDHGEMARVYAIVESQTRVNHPEQAGYFSAAGGVGFIGHDGYPAGLAGSVTVTDVAANLVHRDVLHEAGPILRASRAPEEIEREFMASRDPAFRPTGLELGPDGALYLLDMQRDVIEHPEYIPAKMREKMDIRGGADRGRIYRVMPKAGIEAPRRALARMEARGWVGELAGPNQWRRTTAQRLLVEGRRVEVEGLLARMLTAHTNPVARVHALWTLEGLGLLSDSRLLGALADTDSRVVENAVTAAETRAQRGGAVEARLRDLATTHPQVRVRFLAALAVTLPVAETARALVRDGGEEWMRRAVLTALAEGEVKVLAQLLEGARSGDANRVAAPAAVRAVADLTGARAGADGLLEVLVAGRGVARDWVRALLEGLASGLARRSERLQAGPDVAEAIEGYARAMDAADRPLAWRLGQALGLAPSATQLEAMRAARQVVADGTAAPAERRVALQLLALAPAPEDVALALGLFNGQTPAEVQSAALALVRGPTDAAIARGLLERWRGVHVSLRRDVTQLLLRKRDYHEVLLDGIENGRVKTGELNLDLEDRRRLLRWSVPAVQERAARLLGDGEYGNRQEKVEAWLARLPRTGDRERGREVFERLCASCHRASGIGHEVGPDLTGQAHRSVEDLVSNILDPNMAINPSYVATEVETKDGELVAGIVVAETAEAITLMQAQGVRTTLSRERIRRVETAGASLMPEGLEAGLEPQALRDLVAFMQGR